MKCEYCDSIIKPVPESGICPNCGGKLPANAPTKTPPKPVPLQPNINCCSCCNSRDITMEKQGFAWRRAMLLFFLFPILGILSGFIGRNNLLYRCQTCGHKWKR